jgi:hypothetical protein
VRGTGRVLEPDGCKAMRRPERENARSKGLAAQWCGGVGAPTERNERVGDNPTAHHLRRHLGLGGADQGQNVAEESSTVALRRR